MFKWLLAHLHAPVYERRIRVLTEAILPHLGNGDSILDVGCGGGMLGAKLVVEGAARGLSVRVEGLESFPRGQEPIPVTRYDGGQFPFANKSFDVIIVADVLHHEQNPMALLNECMRVSKRLIVIKDHQISGWHASARVSFIDWAANAAYGVKCLYRYNTPEQWNAVLRENALEPVALYASMDLYPAGLNCLFGRSLQFMAICRVPDQAANQLAV